jgi:hypothetical protein
MGPRPFITCPDEHCLANGAKYFCQIDRDGRSRTGRISDEQGTLQWTYRFRRNPLGLSWSNPFNKPEFVVENADSQVELIVRRATFTPPVFHIIREDRIVGRVRMTSVFRNRYAIEIDEEDTWVFHMPLYRIHFHGYSDKATDLWVGEGPSRMEWSILFRPGANHSRLTPVLAFIHNERWRYG